METIEVMLSVSDSTVRELVRCLSNGEPTRDFSSRAFAVAEERGLIVWDPRKGYGGGYRVK